MKIIACGELYHETPWHELEDSEKRRLLDKVRDSRMVRKEDPNKKKSSSTKGRKKHITKTRTTPTTSDELEATINMMRSGEIDPRYSYLIKKHPGLISRINEVRVDQGKEPLDEKGI